jgi:hypothetical protein
MLRVSLLLLRFGGDDAAATMVWKQNIPAVAVIVGAMTLMGFSQDKLHRLFNEGEVSGESAARRGGEARPGAGYGGPRGGGRGVWPRGGSQ